MISLVMCLNPLSNSTTTGVKLFLPVVGVVQGGPNSQADDAADHGAHSRIFAIDDGASCGSAYGVDNCVVEWHGSIICPARRHVHAVGFGRSIDPWPRADDDFGRTIFVNDWARGWERREKAGHFLRRQLTCRGQSTILGSNHYLSVSIEVNISRRCIHLICLGLAQEAGKLGGGHMGTVVAQAIGRAGGITVVEIIGCVLRISANEEGIIHLQVPRSCLAGGLCHSL